MTKREFIQEKRREFLHGVSEAYSCDFPDCKEVIMNPNHHFTDELSKKEFVISGMCQKCQDEFFCDPEIKGDNY